MEHLRVVQTAPLKVKPFRRYEDNRVEVLLGLSDDHNTAALWILQVLCTYSSDEGLIAWVKQSEWFFYCDCSTHAVSPSPEEYVQHTFQKVYLSWWVAGKQGPVWSVSVTFQKTCKTTNEMNTEYKQKAQSVSVWVSNVEHEWAFRWIFWNPFAERDYDMIGCAI